MCKTPLCNVCHDPLTCTLHTHVQDTHVQRPMTTYHHIKVTSTAKVSATRNTLMMMMIRSVMEHEQQWHQKKVRVGAQQRCRQRAMSTLGHVNSWSCLWMMIKRVVVMVRARQSSATPRGYTITSPNGTPSRRHHVTSSAWARAMRDQVERERKREKANESTRNRGEKEERLYSIFPAENVF